MNNFSRNLVMWLAIALLLAFLFNVFQGSQNGMDSEQSTLAYSDFMSEATSGRISDVSIKGQEITGHYSSGDEFSTLVPENENVVERLQGTGVRITAQKEEGEQISPYNIRLTLSGLDANLAAEAVKQDYYQRPVTLYLGALNSSDQLVADPDPIWNGFMDQMNVVVGGDNGDTIELSAESELAMFSRSKDVLYTNARQQFDSPIGPDSNNPQPDTFFTHLQEMEDITLDWGKRKAGSGGGTRVILDETENGDPREEN